MTAGYLAMLEALLSDGLREVSEPFRVAQVRFVVARQQSDGGFAGRKGGSDLYYTDFALRTLALLAPDHPAMSSARPFVERASGSVHAVTSCFNLLHATRLLRLAPPAESCGAVLSRHGMPAGGFAQGRRLSIYATFLGALCGEMLETALPPLAGAATVVLGLRVPDGGFAESPGSHSGQTNATAAALGLLFMRQALTDGVARPAVSFLSGMQAVDGGFRAHTAAPAGDLLSTFTVLTTLAMLGGLEQIDAGGVGRFVRACVAPAGGFRACPADDTADVEYTYYGLGALALLRAHLATG